ncbi:MAG: IclR family transcriptional regulator C-terminal domain-containing protein [Pigmentiphaga sp.]
MNYEENRDPQSFVRALARGLSLIEALGNQPNGKTLSELALQASLDRATARRLLMTLNTLGYVRHEDGRYQLAPRALSLGYAYLSSLPFWEVAQPLMARLSAQVRESCSAATLDGPYVVYVARIRSNPHIVDVTRTVGSRVPAYCTSLGRVLLADQPETAQRELLAQLPPKALTPYTETDIESLLGILRQVRDQGWSLVDQELELRLRSLAVPVTAGGDKVVAALNISIPDNRGDADAMLKTFLEPLEHTAAQLGTALRARESA